VRLSDSGLAETLREAASVRLALSIPALAAPTFVAALFGDRVQNVFLIGGRTLAVVELIVTSEDPFLLGRSLSATARDFRFLVVGFTPAEPETTTQNGSPRLAAGDRLTAILELHDLERLLRREEPLRGFAVEIESFPLPTRGWVAQLLRVTQGLSAEAAEAALSQLPLCLQKDLTRGEAEEWLAQLQREKVTAVIRAA
jgi:hypothetical protein